MGAPLLLTENRKSQIARNRPPKLPFLGKIAYFMRRILLAQVNSLPVLTDGPPALMADSHRAARKVI
jgi:hypothetical protein